MRVWFCSSWRTKHNDLLKVLNSNFSSDSCLQAVRQMPLDEVVILDADKNEITNPFDDMNIFPPEVVCN